MRVIKHECRGKKESLYHNCNVAFYCEYCGTEQASLFETYNGNMNILSYYKNFLTLDHQCSVCGKVFLKKPGYYLPSASCFVGSDESFTEFYGVAPLRRDEYTRSLPTKNQLVSVDEKFERITEVRQKKEKQQMWDAVEALAQNCDLLPVASKPTGNYAVIKADPEKLKEYIKAIISLENSIYSLKQRLTTLYFERMQNERYAVRCTSEKIIPTKEQIGRAHV